MNVSFDEVDFDCDLTEIAVSRKIKNGAESFEYVLTFSKDVGLQNEDSAFVKTYLKYKEEDENGKKKIVEFDVNLTVIPITRTGSDSAELF
jgi:predicted solute-binding protein